MDIREEAEQPRSGALRFALGIALVLTLSGCLSEGPGGGFGFVSSNANATAGAVESKPAPAMKKNAELAGGKVVVRGPTGYCIDPASLRRGLGGGFALVAACNTLAGTYSGPDVEPVIMTVQVQPGFLKREAPDAAAMAAALAPARALARVNGDGLTLLQLDSGGDKALPAGDPKYWRGAMVINGYLVGIALYAPKGSAMAGSRGKRVLLALAENLREASPVKTFTPVSGPKRLKN